MSDSFQIPIEVAEVYEQKFVPSIFAEWAPYVLDAAAVGPGSRLLDVACGTGIVARVALERLGAAKTVVGVDLNEAMLTVARRIAPDISWKRADSVDLPFAADEFDAVTCQMALMFMPDRVGALAEMARVATAEGRVAVVVPATLDVQPAYRAFVDIAARHVGLEARSLLETYFACGDANELATLAEQAGLEVIELRTPTGVARFESSDDFVATEVEGSPLAERIDDATYTALRDDVRIGLDRYTTTRGTFEIPLVCHVVAARPANRG